MYVRTYVRMYVCMYVCSNEGSVGILCACCVTCQTILAPEYWKSASVKKVSQTDEKVLDALGGKNKAKLDWHRLGVTRKCRRQIHWLKESHISLKLCLARLAPTFRKPASVQKVPQTWEMVYEDLSS